MEPQYDLPLSENLALKNKHSANTKHPFWRHSITPPKNQHPQALLIKNTKGLRNLSAFL